MNEVLGRLLDLLNGKDLAEISITNLVKVAGVYRATFYLHYKSLNDVILDIEKDVIDSYLDLKSSTEDIDIYNNMNIFIDKLGEYVKIDQKYFQLIINTSCFSNILLKLKDVLSEIIISNFDKYNHLQQDDKSMLDIETFAGVVVFAYRDWIIKEDVEFEFIQNYIKNLSKLFFKI